MTLTAKENKYILKLYNVLKKEKRRIPYTREAIPLFRDRFGFEISTSTVLSKWKEAEFKVHKKGNSLGGRISKDDFLAICDEYNNEITCIVKNTHYTRRNVLLLGHKYSIQFNNIKPAKRTQHIAPEYNICLSLEDKV